MGKDKALLPWIDGESFLAHQVKTVGLTVGSDSVFVSGTRQGFNSIPDQQMDRGPVEGVKTILLKCIKNFLKPQVLFVPVDMPLLTQADLSRLIENIGSADAAIFEDMNLPVFIRHPNKVINVISQLEKGSSLSNLSFKNIYQKINTVRISAISQVRLFNINTPKDISDAISTTNTSS